MPENNSPTVVEGWTLSECIHELGGKLHLKDRDFKAYLECSQAEKKQKEETISDLRHENKVKRISLKDKQNGDERVIRTVFQNRRNELLSLQRQTSQSAIEVMDKKVCESAKMLNNLRHERVEKESRLTELQKELDRMVKLQAKPDEHVQCEQTMRSLENALDKSQLKYNTAKNISVRYEEILKVMKEDSMTLPAKLDTMEASLAFHSHELKELEVMRKEAFSARDLARKKLSNFEQETYEAKRARELELSATKKEIEKRKDTVDKVDKRQRAALFTDTGDSKLIQQQMQKRENQKTILGYEDAYLKLKSVTHVSDIKDVVNRVMAQDHIKKELLDQKKERVAEKAALTKAESVLKHQYHDMRFSGQKRISRGEMLLEQVRDHIEQEDKALAKIQDKQERGSKLLINLRTGISALLNQLNAIKIQAPNHNYPKDDPYDELALCHKKLIQLMKEVTENPQLESDLADKLDSQDFHDFLERQLPPENVRIPLGKSETSFSDFDYDSQDNEEALSRDDVKKLGQHILDSKLKPKKRKVKKK